MTRRDGSVLTSQMLQAASDACSYVKGMEKAGFLADRRTQQAVVMCLLIIGEAASKVLDHHPELASANPHIPWSSMRGMRNRIAHGYFSLDMEVVWETVTAAMPELLQALNTLASKQ